MRRIKKLVAVIVLAGAASAASATPLRMEYCVEDLGGGSYQYTFTLILDNNDNTWAPGQGWRWLIFGDEPGICCGGTGVSPIHGFIGDPSSLPVGPWTQYSTSGGGHNGPTMSSVLDYWIPAAIGETLTWRGIAFADVPAEQMRFSTLAGTLNGGVPADWSPMVRSCGGPAPCYANCDGSTVEPILNVDDFTCFINEFAAAQSLPHAQQVTHYANCDGSTVAPSLNVDDFTCFINMFAAGCP